MGIMKILLIIALALTLGADNITICTDKINRATIDAKMSNLRYSWQEYQRALEYLKSAKEKRAQAMELCEHDLRKLGLYSIMELEQMELDGMIEALTERLEDGR